MLQRFLSLSFKLVVNPNRRRTLENYCFQGKITKMGCSTSKTLRISHKGENSPKMARNQQCLDDEYIEGVVCNESDIGENEMKAFDLDEGKVLIVKQKGVLSALGAKCTHYSAPLQNGALGDGRIRCQWHGACFNILTGDIEDFPGLDSLPCHQVRVENGQIKVRAKKSELTSNKRIKSMAKRDPCQSQHYIVIGGGPAGATCVEVLRQEGFKGKLTIICKENYLPYDRVKVSKAMDFDIEKAQFRDDKFYQKNDIEIYKGVEAIGIDINEKLVKLSKGDNLEYDKLFIATGMKANKLNIEGANLKNVLTLRNYEDAVYTNSQLGDDKEVVVLGSSFIAMEAANYCLNKVKKVTVIMRDIVPFKPLLGNEIGTAFLKLFKEKGVNFCPNNSIKKCIGDENETVTKVQLTDGTELKADIVIMGVGSRCLTDFLKNTNLLRTDGTIEVDEHLKSNIDGIYVGGDIAYAPIWSNYNKKASIGHYSLAHYHGRIAALNMLGKNKPLKAVPFFWTMLFGKGVRYAGHGNYNDIIYEGSVENLKFVAFYLNGDEVVAVSSCGMDPIVSQFAELMAQNKKLYRNDLKNDKFEWIKTKLNH